MSFLSKKDTSSFTGYQFENTRFWVDGQEVNWKNYVLNGWIRLPNSESPLISIRGPPHFSGTLPLKVRGTIVDFSMSGQAVKSSAPATINVNIFPDADKITEPTKSTVGVEDRGPVPFGSTLTGVRVRDNGNTRFGNNPETETFSKVKLQLPPDSSSVIYKVSAGSFLPESHRSTPGDYSASGTAVISWNPSTRVYEITSSIITGSSNIGLIPLANRRQASNDILNTLSVFVVEIGPEHTDANGSIGVTVTTLDVNLGAYSTLDNSFTHGIIILAVADVSCNTNRSPHMLNGNMFRSSLIFCSLSS